MELVSWKYEKLGVLNGTTDVEEVSAVSAVFDYLNNRDSDSENYEKVWIYKWKSCEIVWKGMKKYEIIFLVGNYELNFCTNLGLGIDMKWCVKKIL